MTTINTIKASIKSATLLKTGLLGLVAASGMGLISLPAKADQINQDARHTTVQEGYGNTSVTQSRQDAKIKNDAYKGSYYDPYYSYPLPGKDVINQSVDDFTRQHGEGNTSVTQSEQEAEIRGGWGR